MSRSGRRHTQGLVARVRIHLPRDCPQLRSAHRKAWAGLEQCVQAFIDRSHGPMLELVPYVHVAARATRQYGKLDVVARPKKEVGAKRASMHERSDTTCAAALVTAPSVTGSLGYALGELHTICGRRRCLEVTGVLKQSVIQIKALVKLVLPWTAARKQQPACFLFHLVARRVNIQHSLVKRFADQRGTLVGMVLLCASRWSLASNRCCGRITAIALLCEWHLLG